MADGLAENLTLADATVSLYRDIKFMNGTKEIGSGDRMVVQYLTANEEDVVIVHEGAEPQIKRLVPQVEITTSSLAVPATSRGGFSLAAVDAETEKRLLAIYKMFPAGGK
jgi:hypothetical protein